MGISIHTSKPGCLWPTGYWKPLIDSVCRGGAKKDPCLHYPEFSRHLPRYVCESNGRFFPTTASQLGACDDAEIASIQVVRVPPGDESFTFPTAEAPDTTGWVLFQFPYMGTIGNSKYERQSRENRLALALRQHELFVGEFAPTSLSLHFQLSAIRRDRDLDNLADGLMPFFNKLLPDLSVIRLSKAAPTARAWERLWVSVAEPIAHSW